MTHSRAPDAVAECRCATRRPARAAAPAYDPRGGFALAGALVLLLALLGLATAMWFTLAQQHALLGAARAQEQTRLAADAALRIAVAGWNAGEHDGAAFQERTIRTGALPDGTRFSASVMRLDESRYLVRGRGWSAPPLPLAERFSAAIVRSLDAHALLARFDAAVEAASADLGAGAHLALADADDGAATATGERLCAPLEDAVVLRADAGALSVHPDAIVAGGYDAVAADALRARFPDAIGFLSADSLAQLADRMLTGGTITPRPQDADGACQAGLPSNWGDPGGGACAGLAPLIHSGGDLTMDGGAGQGVLLVDGDLTLRAGATFHGLIIVRGRVTIEEGEVNGALVAEHASIRGTVRLDRCTIADQVSRVRALSRAYSAGARVRIPAF